MLRSQVKMVYHVQLTYKALQLNPDEAVVRSIISSLDNFKGFKDILRRIEEIPVGEA